MINMKSLLIKQIKNEIKKIGPVCHHSEALGRRAVSGHRDPRSLMLVTLGYQTCLSRDTSTHAITQQDSLTTLSTVPRLKEHLKMRISNFIAISYLTLVTMDNGRSAWDKSSVYCYTFIILFQIHVNMKMINSPLSITYQYE